MYRPQTFEQYTYIIFYIYIYIFLILYFNKHNLNKLFPCLTLFDCEEIHDFGPILYTCIYLAQPCFQIQFIN